MALSKPRHGAMSASASSEFASSDASRSSVSLKCSKLPMVVRLGVVLTVPVALLLLVIGVTVQDAIEKNADAEDIEWVGQVCNYTLQMLDQVQYERAVAIFFIQCNYTDVLNEAGLHTNYSTLIMETNALWATFDGIVSNGRAARTAAMRAFVASQAVMQVTLRQLHSIRMDIQGMVTDWDSAVDEYEDVMLTMLASLHVAPSVARYNSAIASALDAVAWLTELYESIGWTFTRVLAYCSAGLMTEAHRNDIVVALAQRAIIISSLKASIPDWESTYAPTLETSGMVQMFLALLEPIMAVKFPLANSTLGPYTSVFPPPGVASGPYAPASFLGLSFGIILPTSAAGTAQLARALSEVEVTRASARWSLNLAIAVCVVGVFVTALLGVLTYSHVMQPYHKLRMIKNRLRERMAAMSMHEEATARFVPLRLTSMMGKKSILDVNLGDHSYHVLSVMFCDIVGFATLAERMTPGELFTLLNSVSGRCSEHYHSFSGTVDKYMGDAVIVLFQDAQSALMCADHVHDEVSIVSAEHRMRQRLGSELRVGIGIHSGDMILGTVGAPMRMDLTIISDTVNVASRVQALSKRYRAATLLTAAAAQRLIRQDDVRYVATVFPRGRQMSVKMYEGISDESGAKKREHHELFDGAITAYERRDFAGARQRFLDYLSVVPDDALAKVKMTFVLDALAYGCEEDWDGTDDFDRLMGEDGAHRGKTDESRRAPPPDGRRVTYGGGGGGVRFEMQPDELVVQSLPTPDIPAVYIPSPLDQSQELMELCGARVPIRVSADSAASTSLHVIAREISATSAVSNPFGVGGPSRARVGSVLESVRSPPRAVLTPPSPSQAVGWSPLSGVRVQPQRSGVVVASTLTDPLSPGLSPSALLNGRRVFVAQSASPLAGAEPAPK